MRFGSKTVLITGAAGNLGRAVAEAFDNEGATLALVDLRSGDLQAAFSDMERHLFVEANLLRAEDAMAAADRIVARFGLIDVLCNLAGGFRMGEAVHETSATTWDFLLGLNAGSLLHMVRAAVSPHVGCGIGQDHQYRCFRRSKGRRADGRLCRLEKCRRPLHGIHVSRTAGGIHQR